MSNNQAFLVISDLHLSGNLKENRISYDKELCLVFSKIENLIKSYTGLGYKVSLIFLGDIFDRSYKSPHKYGTDSSVFIRFNNFCENLYTVVGNHELHFYVNNPFWTLVSTVDSKKLMDSNYNTQPLGYEDTLKIVDTLEIGNVAFHFNHFGCQDNLPLDNKVNIGLYHKSLYHDMILKEAEDKGLNVMYAKTEMNSPEHKLSTVLKYDYAMLGHMHWFYGTWKDQNTYIYGLASLGRPSISEISDEFLERNIPAVIIKENIFSEIQDNIFNLSDREKCVREEVVALNHTQYEIQKIIKESKQYKAVSDDPIINIKTHLVNNDRTLKLFDTILENSVGNNSENIINSIYLEITDIERKLRK